MKFPEQFKEVDLGRPPRVYEAFLYRFTNLDNGKIYIGIHKGYVGDGYWHSSQNDLFKSDFSNVKSKFRYEILDYNNYNYLSSKEYDMLVEAKAPNNDLFYNDSVGSPKIRKPNLKKCQKFVSQIEGRKFDVVIKLIEEMMDIYKVQSRYMSFDSETQAEIGDRIDDAGGSTEKCNPLVVYVKRKGIIIDGVEVMVDVLGDGNHTLYAAAAAKHAIDIPVMYIPEEVHSEYSDQELELIGNLLNRKPEIIKRPTNKLDALKSVVSAYENFQIPVQSDYNKDTVSAMGFSSGQVKTILKNAAAKIEKTEEEESFRLIGEVFINWVAEPHKRQMEDLVDSKYTISY